MFKYFKILQSFLLVIVFAVNLCAEDDGKLIARYQFKRVIDRDFMDSSGNGYDGALMMNENSAYVKTEEGEAVQFGKTGDRISLPYGLTPQKTGKITIRLKANAIDGRQYIWQYYNPRGDGMELVILDKKISLLYYQRNARKWHEVIALVPSLQPGNWINIDLSWDFSKRVQIFVDGKLTGEKELSVQPIFPGKDGEILIGNERSGKFPFKGQIRLFEFWDKPSGTKSNEIEKKLNPDEVKILENKHLKIFFSKDDLVPMGAVDKISGESLLASSYFPSEMTLWRFTLKRSAGNGTNIVIDNRMPAEKSIHIKETDTGQQAVLNWTKIKASDDNTNIAVTITVDLPNESHFSYWQIQIKRGNTLQLIWLVDFPILNFVQPNKNPHLTKLAIPNYWGQLISDPFGVEKTTGNDPSINEYTYPANMPMQFFALYGEKTGIYAATHDSAGYTKTFSLATIPMRQRIRLEVSGMPSNAEQVSTIYIQPYSFTFGRFTGDWYDASQIYRAWAIKQIWCQAGPLSIRKDIPDFLRHAQLALRMWGAADDNSVTVNLVKSLRNRGKGSNTTGVEQYLKTFGPPIIAFWYDWIAAKYTDNTAIPKNYWKGPTNGAGNGRFIEPWSDVQPTLAKLTNQGAKVCAYMNSVMYDQGRSPFDNDAKLMHDCTILDENGEEIMYNKTDIPCWRMNAGEKIWQDRYSLLAKRAIELGFSGVYMDSFGRAGIPMGFHPKTGKTVGRGNDLFYDQRILGSRVKETIKKINGEAIVSAEAATEGFIDIVDLNLIHFNVLTDSCPLYFAVYHDYQINYGRMFARSYEENREFDLRNYKLNLSSLFVNGAVLGRFFQCFPGPPYPFANDEKAYLDFLEQLVNTRKQYNAFLHLGKMMRPPRISPDPKKLSEGTEKRPYTVSEIMSSSWQSSEGKVIFVVVNVTNKPKEIKLLFNAEEYGFKIDENISAKYRLKDKGSILDVVKNGKIEISQTLDPWDVHVLEFSRN